MFKPMTLATAGLMMLTLAGCGDGGSAVETRDRSASDEAAPTTRADAAGEAGKGGGQPAPALTANRRESVDEKVVRLFERNGADFDARTPEDYLRKVRAFTGSPPSGTERVERANGDVLLYQASTNTFAVLSRDGVPKTMFKPDSGAAYWAEQKERAPTFGRRRQGSDRSEE
ncbi:hypothetical protein GCM10009422_07000 [Brevundimonas kwangchunensis]|uniref:S-type pyocin family protein n=1 Tax=Brevundimonas kwangchunensis TaxID=322163 RepID=A0ABN1GMJ4_9CAUL